VALLIGAKAAGIVGALFAVPLTVVLVAVLQETRGEEGQTSEPDRAEAGPPPAPGSEAPGNGR